MPPASPNAPPPPSTLGAAFWRGLASSAPFLLVVGPFAAVVGAVASEAGLDLAQVMTLSVLVIAGAAQLTAVQLMTENAPAILVLVSALAVNLRMAMYSAALQPWIGAAPLWQRALAAFGLIDQSYALSIANFEREPRWTIPQRMALFAGTISLLAPTWYLSTLVGALAGRQIPAALALDFAVPVTFIAVIAPTLRTIAHLVAACVAIVLGLAFAGLPSGLGLLLAGMLGMAAGAEAERRGWATPLRPEAPR